MMFICPSVTQTSCKLLSNPDRPIKHTAGCLGYTAHPMTGECEKKSVPFMQTCEKRRRVPHFHLSSFFVSYGMEKAYMSINHCQSQASQQS